MSDNLEAVLEAALSLSCEEQRQLAEQLPATVQLTEAERLAQEANPAVISLLTDHSAEVERLLRLPFRIHQITRGDIIASHALRQAHGLLVNDSINLACAHRLALTSI